MGEPRGNDLLPKAARAPPAWASGWIIKGAPQEFHQAALGRDVFLHLSPLDFALEGQPLDLRVVQTISHGRALPPGAFLDDRRALFDAQVLQRLVDLAIAKVRPLFQLSKGEP